MLQGLLYTAGSSKMDNSFPTSLLVVAGLLRLAGFLGASKSELWSSPSADRSFIGDGLVTAKSHLVSRREDGTEEVTLRFDSLTSDLANKDVSHLHEVSGTETEGTSEDGLQTLSVFARKPASPKQLLDGPVLDPQSKAPITRKSLFSTGMPKSKAASFSPQLEQLAISLSREEGKTGELSMTLKQPVRILSKTVAMDVLATALPDSEPSGSAGQRLELSIKPAAVAVTRDLHTFAFTENRTDTEGHPAETMQTTAKKGMEKLLTSIPKASQWTQAESQQLDMRTSVVGRTPGPLAQTQSPSVKGSSTALFHQPFSEEKVTIIPRTKLTQPSSLASFPSGEMVLEDETTEFRMIENPAPLTASQSNTHSSSLLLTPNTLSSESPPHSARPRDTTQSALPKITFPPQFSLFSKSGTSDESEEHLQKGLILHYKIDHQTTTQTSHVRLSETVGEPRETQPAPSLQETTLEGWPKSSLPLHSTAQPPDIPLLVDGKPQVNMLGMPQLAHPVSPHAGSTVSSVGISSTVAPPSDNESAPAGHIMQGTSKSQLPNTVLMAHGEQPSPDGLVPSLSEPESLATSAPTKPQTRGTHDGQKRPVSLVSPSSAEHGSEPSTAALASTFPHPGFSTSLVADSSHSEPKLSELPTLVRSESWRTMSGTSVPFQAQQQLLGNSASTHTGATASGSLVPFQVEPNVSGASAAGLNVPGTTFLGHSSQKLSPDTSVSFSAKAPSLLAQSLQTTSIHPHASGELRMGISGVNVPSHAKSQKSGGVASFIDESHLSVTSAHVESVTNEALLEQELPISIDARPQRTESSASPPTKSQLLVVSAHAPIEHELLDELAKLRGQPLPPNESHTPKTPSSTPAQHRSLEMTFFGHLKSRLSNASAFVHAEPLSPETPVSTAAETQMPSRLTSVHSGLQLQAAPGLPVTPHTAGKASEGTRSPQTSLPTSLSGTQRTTVQDISIPASSRRSPPSLDGPASPITPQTKINIPLPLAHMMEENITSLRTTPMLAVAGAQDLMQSSLGFIQHLSRPDIGSLDSFASSGILGMSPSLQYLSHLVQNAENMVCLQPMRNTTPTLGEPIASGQEMLVLSSVLGFSHPGVSSLIQMSPSSVILVKPVFVFLPPEAPKGPLLLPTEEEVGHDASLSFTSKAALALVTPGSIQERMVGIGPLVSTLRHSARTNTHSPNLLDHQDISEPAPSASPKHRGVSLVRSNTSSANPFLYGLSDRSTRTKNALTTDHDEVFQLSALDSQRLEEDNPVSLSVRMPVKHHISATPPAMVPIQQQPKTLSPTTELLSTLDKVSSQHSLTEPSASRIPTSSLQAASSPALLSSIVMLHTEEHPYGSVTPVTSISKNSEESLSASSARNMKLPLKVGHLAPSSSASHGSLVNEHFGKTPSKVQYVPNTVSTFPMFSTGKEHKEAAALNNPYVEAFLMANETSSYHANTTFHKPSDSHPIPSKAPRRVESLKTTLSTLFSADALMQMTLPGKHPQDIMNHQTHSRPSADVPSQVSTHSSSVKLATEYNPTTVMLRGRIFLASAAEHLEPRLSTVETKTLTDIETQTKATSLMSTMPGTDSGHSSTSLVATDFRLTSSSSSSSYNAAGTTEHQNEVHKSPLHPIHSFAPSSTLKDGTSSLVGGVPLLLETSQSDSYWLQPSVAGTTEMAASLPSASKDWLLKHRRSKIAGTGDQFLVASHLDPQPARLEVDHPEKSRLAGDERKQEAASSLPISSSVFSTALNAPAFLMTTLLPSVAPDGLVGSLLNQASHLQSLPPGISEIFLSPEAQAQPTLGSLSDTPDSQTVGDFSADATRTSRGLNLYTTGEQVPITSDSIGEGGGRDSVADLPPWDSTSTVLHWREHHRRLMRSDDVFMDGFAVVSDDACGSGNYTAEMSLQTVAMGKPPFLPDSFLAQIVLRDNRSHPTLNIKSCCVTPTARPAGPEASCCLFPRSLRECAHIQMHQNSKSQTANFTIQLFRMVSHPVAYLHCELSVCLSDDAGCEQSCLSTFSKPSSRDSYQTFHNIISLGPVPKTQVEFTPGPVTGSDMTMMLPALLGLSAGIAVLTSAVVFLWLCRKRQIKMAAALELERMEAA